MVMTATQDSMVVTDAPALAAEVRLQRARGRRAAPAAGPKRHLPRLDPRPQPPRQGGPRLQRPPAAGLEILDTDRGDAPGGHDDLLPPLRVDPCPGVRPLRGPHPPRPPPPPSPPLDPRPRRLP